jgi:hypothetical protein
MLDDKSLLELCLKITGAFESGVPSYTTVTGNFDGMGLSCGVLQWNAGQGTLQTLVQNIGQTTGWDKAQSFFHSDIHHFAVLRSKEAVQWCLDHYIQTGNTNVDPAAKACWQAFLTQPEAVAAQVQMATNGALARAKALAAKFCPTATESTRVLAFFFDLVTQSGGMENQRGKVDPLPAGQTPDVSDVLTYTAANHQTVASLWTGASAADDLAKLLLYYAYRRSLLSNAQYVWDALSRRGSIACRTGIVHGATVNFTGLLD